MITDIPSIDREDLSVYAFANMYRAMRKAEQAAKDYAHNLKIVANSTPGDRSIPREQDLNTLASDNKWYMQQAEMYAKIFLSAEMADDSPRRKDFQRAVELVDAHLTGKLIPEQRTQR